MINKNIRVNNEFYVAPVYNEMIEAGKKIVFHNVGSSMYGLVVPEDLKYFMEQDVSKKVFPYYEHFPDDYDHLLELKNRIKATDTSGFGQIKQQAFRWIERDLEQILRRFIQYEHDQDIIIEEIE